ncbi:MAG: hypothetical protein A4E61_00944 [Syntrophorhabdus sp. PtaB.Bin184]|nr:MAG: hypothetical protein A4E61_00944 [Syntrophorhabdus sp. PtaB.Bin184]
MTPPPTKKLEERMIPVARPRISLENVLAMATSPTGKKPVTKKAWKKRRTPVCLTGESPRRTVKTEVTARRKNMIFLRLNRSTMKPQATATPMETSRDMARMVLA